MDLVEAYSNLADVGKRLRRLLDLPAAARPRGPAGASKQVQRRLRADEATELVAVYEAGGRVTKLAAEFGVHRVTVHTILERAGVLQPPGIAPEDVPRAVRQYEAGSSLADVAATFGVAPATVNRALRAAGVAIRPPGGTRRQC